MNECEFALHLQEGSGECAHRGAGWTYLNYNVEVIAGVSLLNDAVASLESDRLQGIGDCETFPLFEIV